MNTTSKIGAIWAGLLLVTGCILPGPWDYSPRDKPAFRGILASVYAVADRPVANACFERLLTLDEGYTAAFSFYDSATVGIEGRFSTGGQTLVLQRDSITPNCFTGNASVHFLRGETYNLTARFVWDSAGTRVVSMLRATARIPTSFRVSDTAAAPRVAKQGLAFFQTVDTNSEKYQTDLIHYLRGDTLFYIGGNSRLNNLSHYFHSERSDDVNGVLVTQRYDTTILGGRPVTSFDLLFGIKPDSGQFYYPGDHRRLILDPSTISQSGYNVLDSIGVVNAWLWAGPNRLYFYGVEKAYTDYNFSNVNDPGGGPVDQNPKITPLTNVSGGRGFFAGMIVDSFDLFIKTDSMTKVYSYPATRAHVCRNDGWFESRDCAGWYREYCHDNGEVPSDCQLDVVYTCLENTTPTSGSCGILADDSSMYLEATRRYCIDHDYPINVPDCAAVKHECETGSPGNGCQLILWKKCDLDYWKPAVCTEGRKSYCSVYGDTQRELCRGVSGN